MNHPPSRFAATLLAGAVLLRGAAALFGAGDWPCFRGADGLGVVSAQEAKNLPTDFDGPTGKLIRWKTPLTLPGESSPIVAANRVFVTGADPAKRTLFCFDADTGKLLWQQNINTGAKPAPPADPDAAPPPAGPAAPTPATDGQRVVALFGNGDLAAFDLAGKQLWSRNLGFPESGYGFASSPIVHGGRVIIQFDQGTDASSVQSSLLAIDIATGKTLWQSKRPVHASWTTPIIINPHRGISFPADQPDDDRGTGFPARLSSPKSADQPHDNTQIITLADPWVIAYRFDTGAELWRAKCLGQECAPSATYADGIVYTALARFPMTALKTDGTGDVTKTHILWQNEDDRFPEVPSPVTNGKQVFLALDTGSLVAYNAATGKQLWELDCETEFRSSPTLVGDQLWIFDRKGVLHRVAAGPAAKLLGTANLGEKTDAQPAYVGSRIYVRGKTNLYCIGTK